MSQTLIDVTEVLDAAVLSEEIRDGLLQDLLAVGLLVRSLDPTTSDEGASRLATASTAIDADVRVVRGLIDRLRLAA